MFKANRLSIKQRIPPTTITMSSANKHGLVRIHVCISAGSDEVDDDGDGGGHVPKHRA